MSVITKQNSMDIEKQIEQIEEIELQRTPSESTFTRRTNSVHAIIKELILGIICILQLYTTIKLSK